MPVIVAVEGPSAAGKTTWCRATGEQFVAEYSPTGQEPDGSDPTGQAIYWAHVNAQRWSQALALEAATGVAVCDSDPLKLHYSWCLAAVGVAPITRFEHELMAVRRMFTQRRLGFADVVLLSIPDPRSTAAAAATHRGPLSAAPSFRPACSTRRTAGRMVCSAGST